MLVYLATPEDSPLVLDDHSVLDAFRDANRQHAKFADHPEDAEIVIFFESFGYKRHDYVGELRGDPRASAH
jgi:hypothetical protein